VTNGCIPQTTFESITICPEDSVFINGFWESVPGQYSNTFLDVNQCDSTHTVSLSLHAVAPWIENLALCEFDSVLVFNQWIFGTQTVSQVEQTTNGCWYNHTVNVQMESCILDPSVIFVPNVFTPNGDLVNDTFEIVIQNGELVRGWIFNRWGNVICTFSPTQLTWDGKDELTGIPVLDGVYTYLIYFNPADTVNEMYQGFVTVVK
jgi:gliding motility-associated-like protein